MPVTGQPADPQSAQMIANLQANGAWGGNPGSPRAFGITGLGGGSGTGIDVYYTNDPVTPPTSILVDISGFNAGSDPIPTIPVPSGGVPKGFESGDLTGQNGNGGDCHYIVMDIPNQREVDAWVSTISGNTSLQVAAQSSGLSHLRRAVGIKPVVVRDVQVPMRRGSRLGHFYFRLKNWPRDRSIMRCDLFSIILK